MRKVQIPVLYKHFCYLKKYSPNCILIISIQLLQDVTNVTGVGPILLFP